MPKKEAPLEHLNHYMPAGASEKMLEYLNRYRVHLTITRTRKSILGDYRHATHQDNHRISVNGSLNKYAFLITLIHELGHLVTFQQYGHRVSAHGKTTAGFSINRRHPYALGKVKLDRAILIGQCSSILFDMPVVAHLTSIWIDGYIAGFVRKLLGIVAAGGRILELRRKTDRPFAAHLVCDQRQGFCQ